MALGVVEVGVAGLEPCGLPIDPLRDLVHLLLRLRRGDGAPLPGEKDFRVGSLAPEAGPHPAVEDGEALSVRRCEEVAAVADPVRLRLVVEEPVAEAVVGDRQLVVELDDFRRVAVQHPVRGRHRRGGGEQRVGRRPLHRPPVGELRPELLEEREAVHRPVLPFELHHLHPLVHRRVGRAPRCVRRQREAERPLRRRPCLRVRLALGGAPWPRLLLLRLSLSVFRPRPFRRHLRTALRRRAHPFPRVRPRVRDRGHRRENQSDHILHGVVLLFPPIMPLPPPPRPAPFSPAPGCKQTPVCLTQRHRGTGSCAPGRWLPPAPRQSNGQLAQASQRVSPTRTAVG